MNRIEIFRYRITKQVLDRAPQGERTLYLQLGLLANEINLLQRDLLVQSNTMSLSDLEQEAASAHVLLIARLLAGRTYEAWQLLTKNVAVRRMYEENAGFNRAWSKLGAYFGKGNNLVALIRNKIAFHNDANLAIAAYERLGELELNEHITAHRGGCLFGSAQGLLTITICELTQETDYGLALGRLMDELIDVAAMFSDLVHAYLPEFWRRHVDNGDGIKLESLVVENAPLLGNITLPFFCAMPGDGG